MFHHSRPKDTQQEVHRSPLSRILHSDVYLARHRPCPTRTSTAPEFSSAPLSSTTLSSLRDGDTILAETTSVCDHDIGQIETVILNSDDIPITSDYAQHQHNHHRHPPQHHPHSQSHPDRPEISRRATLAHPFRWTRRSKTSSSDSSSTSSSVDVNGKPANGGLKIKLKFKRMKGHGMHAIHEIFGGSKARTVINVDLGEIQSENICQFCIEPQSIVTAQEHDQAVSHHLEPGVSPKTTAVDPIWALGKDGSDDFEGSFDPAMICCPLPIDELVPDSPLLCSSPMVEIDMPEFWSLDREIVEEEKEKEKEKEKEPDVIVESGDSKIGVWTIDGVQSIQDQSLTSALRPFNTTTLPGDLLSLIKHDTLNWYGHLYLQHILLTAVNLLAPSWAAFRSKTGLELTIYLEEVANLPLIGTIPSISAELPSLPAQADMQRNEEKEDTPSLENLDPSTETSEEETPAQEPIGYQLHGNICKKCSSYIRCSSEKGSTLEYPSKMLVMTSVELSAQNGSEGGNASISDSTVDGKNDSETTIARRRMLFPVLLYTPFKPFQLLSHQGSSRHQMYHPILGLLAKSLGVMAGKKTKTYSVGNVGLWSL